MATNTDADWEKWGAREPYFGVLTLPEYRASALAENRDKFFTSGKHDIDLVLGDIARFYGDVPRRRTLDFGCGVGRLVLQLATHFDAVVGVDISDAMLAEAGRNCAATPHISLVKSDDRLSRVEGRFDLVHSYMVLQHIPMTRGLEITDRLLERVETGGVAVLHYSTQRILSPLREAIYLTRQHVPFGNAALNILQGRAWDTPPMQMNNYRLTDILRRFERNGFRDMMIVPDWHASALTVRVYGRKSSPASR